MNIEKRVIATRCDFMRDDKATWNFDKPLRKQFTGVEQMTIDIEKLALDSSALGKIKNEEYVLLVEGEMVFDNKSLKQFAEAYAAKVLEDKEREVAEWKEVARRAAALELKYKSESKNKDLIIAELQAHINDLREKLETALTSLRKYENGI